MTLRAGWHTGQLTIASGEDFDFWRTVYSHGWCDLQPFSFDPEHRTLSRIISIDGGAPVACTLADSHAGISVTLTSRSPITADIRRSVRQQLRACLRMDEDFHPFFSAARKHSRFRWIAATRSGRMLRSPTVFEDAVRMICTTNCSWALTRIMIGNLVKIAGTEFDEHRHAFPHAEAIAGLTERTLRANVKAGYRAPYLLELARLVAAGKFDLEPLRRSTLPSGVLMEKLLQIKGVGPYAAENLLKLLGRYDRLGLDSWSRARFYQLHCGGRKVKDSTIERHYAEYGEWRGLFFWLEMTRDWHEGAPEDPKLKPERSGDK